MTCASIIDPRVQIIGYKVKRSSAVLDVLTVTSIFVRSDLGINSKNKIGLSCQIVIYHINK